jgi:hypothetical protein
MIRAMAATGLATLAIALAGCRSTPEVSYSRDVSPILKKKCVTCHTPPDGEGYNIVGLDMASYEGIIQGTYYGPIIEPGDSRHSIFNMAGERRIHVNSNELRDCILLSEEEMEVLRAWVDQGARNN